MKSCLMLLVVFAVMFTVIYFVVNSGEDCVRILPDGAVRCSCDFPDNDSWEAYLKQVKGSYESVVLEDPKCK